MQLENIFQQNLSFPNIHLDLPEFYETDLEMLNKILNCSAVWTSTKPPGQCRWEAAAFKMNFFLKEVFNPPKKTLQIQNGNIFP